MAIHSIFSERTNLRSEKSFFVIEFILIFVSGKLIPFLSFIYLCIDDGNSLVFSINGINGANKNKNANLTLEGRAHLDKISKK